MGLSRAILSDRRNASTGVVPGRRGTQQAGILPKIAADPAHDSSSSAQSSPFSAQEPASPAHDAAFSAQSASCSAQRLSFAAQTLSFSAQSFPFSGQSFPFPAQGLQFPAQSSRFSAQRLAFSAPGLEILPLETPGKIGRIGFARQNFFVSELRRCVRPLGEKIFLQSKTALFAETGGLARARLNGIPTTGLSLPPVR